MNPRARIERLGANPPAIRERRWPARSLLMAIGLIAVLAAGASGCAVTGEQFRKAQAPSGTAVVYVYRPYAYAGSLIHPAVTCAGQSAEIGPGGYYPYVVPAGQVICRVATQSGDEVELTASSGREYFIREEIGWGSIVGFPHLDPQDTDQAQGEIQACCKLHEAAPQP